MKVFKSSFILDSIYNNKKMLCDVSHQKNAKPKKLIVFVHGFKGFKDWGHFNFLANKFAEEGFVFVKLNLSHNGTSPESPLEYDDLEAFGNNNYTIELDDIKVLLDHIESNDFIVPKEEFDINRIFLIGHSRGGGVSIIKASEDARIKKLVTWASVAKFGTMASGKQLEEWKEKGVIYVYNGRTKQNMPLYYQLAEEFLSNLERFSILKCASKLTIPYLNIHGDNDETVPVSAVSDLKAHYPNMKIHIIENANHVFDATHPFVGEVLPEHAQEMFDETVAFLNE